MPVRRGTNRGARGTSADSPRRAVGRSSPHPQATTPGGRKWIAHSGHCCWLRIRSARGTSPLSVVSRLSWWQLSRSTAKPRASEDAVRHRRRSRIVRSRILSTGALVRRRGRTIRHRKQAGYGGDRRRFAEPMALRGSCVSSNPAKRAPNSNRLCRCFRRALEAPLGKGSDGQPGLRRRFCRCRRALRTPGKEEWSFDRPEGSRQAERSSILTSRPRMDPPPAVSDTDRPSDASGPAKRPPRLPSTPSQSANALRTSHGADTGPGSGEGRRSPAWAKRPPW